MKLRTRQISARDFRNQLGTFLQAASSGKKRYIVNRWSSTACAIVTADDLNTLRALSDISAQEIARMPVNSMEAEIARGQLLAWRKALDLEG